MRSTGTDEPERRGIDSGGRPEGGGGAPGPSEPPSPEGGHRQTILDLDRGLPTTAEDVAALRRARASPGAAPTAADTAAYLRFLAQFPAPAAGELRARPGPARGAPFRLSDDD